MPPPSPAKSRKSFVRYTIQTIAVQFLVLTASLGSGIITARELGKELVGVYVLLLMVKNVAFRFGSFGLGTAISFFVGRRLVQTRHMIGVALGLATFCSLIAIAGLLLVRGFSWSPWQDISPKLFWLSLLTVPTIFFSTYLERILTGQLNVTPVNITNTLTEYAEFACVAVFLLVFKMGVQGAVLSLVVGDLIGFSYTVTYYLRHRREIVANSPEEGSHGMALVGGLWKFGFWQHMVISAMYLIEELPTLMLKTVTKSNEFVGLFSRARGLGRHSRLMTMPIAQVLFPFTAASEEKEAVQRTNVLCRNMLFITTMVTTVGCFIAEPFIVFLYGEQFRSASAAFYALAPGVAVWPVGQLLATHLSASGNPKRVFLASIPPILVGAIGGYWLVTRFGATGAGLTGSIIYTLQTCMRLFAYTRLHKTPAKEVLLVKPRDFHHYTRIPAMLLGRTKAAAAK